MMTGWAHGAKCVLHLAAQHRLRGGHCRACCAHGCLPAVRIEQSIRVNRMIRATARIALVACLGQMLTDAGDSLRCMHSLQMCLAGQWRFAAIEKWQHPAGYQLVFDRLQARGRFGVPFTHFMQQAIRVREKCGTHERIMHECGQCLIEVSMLYTCGSTPIRPSAIRNKL